MLKLKCVFFLSMSLIFNLSSGFCQDLLPQVSKGDLVFEKIEDTLDPAVSHFVAPIKVYEQALRTSDTLGESITENKEVIVGYITISAVLVGGNYVIKKVFLEDSVGINKFDKVTQASMKSNPKSVLYISSLAENIDPVKAILGILNPGELGMNAAIALIKRYGEPGTIIPTSPKEIFRLAREIVNGQQIYLDEIADMRFQNLYGNHPNATHLVVKGKEDFKKKLLQLDKEISKGKKSKFDRIEYIQHGSEQGLVTQKLTWFGLWRKNEEIGGELIEEIRGLDLDIAEPNADLRMCACQSAKEVKGVKDGPQFLTDFAQMMSSGEMKVHASSKNIAVGSNLIGKVVKFGEGTIIGALGLAPPVEL
ncbi:hypothetical protein N9N67_06800, partial [Bacteriovoracaceae bacterium]|nr:hypothetical protein [Bacteriovoracaceae bacterium]